MENIKASYDLIRELQRMRLPFVLLRPDETIPEYVDAVISFQAAKRNQNNVAVYDGNARRTILRALSLSKGKEYFDDVVIGVDPGKRAGLAILAEGELIEAYTVAEGGLERELRGILEYYPARSFIFRIGKGRVPEEAILQIKKDSRAKIGFVCEAKMSIPPKYRTKGLRKDAKSALMIALSGEVDRP